MNPVTLQLWVRPRRRMNRTPNLIGKSNLTTAEKYEWNFQVALRRSSVSAVLGLTHEPRAQGLYLDHACAVPVET